MMLSMTWQHYLATQVVNEAFDKQQKQIFGMTMASISNKDCISSLKSNPSLCFLAVAPVSSDVFMIHQRAPG